MAICSGKHVRVTEGPYEGMTGTVDEVDAQGVWLVFDGEPALGFGVPEADMSTGPFSPDELEPVG